jgi:hypothetical protein
MVPSGRERIVAHAAGKSGSRLSSHQLQDQRAVFGSDVAMLGWDASVAAVERPRDSRGRAFPALAVAGYEAAERVTRLTTRADQRGQNRA